MSRVFKSFLYLIYFALLAVLVIVIIHSFRNSSTPKVAHTKTMQHQSTTKTSKTKSTPKQTTKKPTTSTPSSSSSSSSSSSTIATPPTSLTNTGPGNMVGLFVLTSGVGVAAHRRWLLKRAAKLSR